MFKKTFALLLLAILPLAGCSFGLGSTSENLSAEVATPQAKCQINTDCPAGQWCYVTDTENYCKPNGN
ncbi:MAG: hypothetical protein WC304_00045 [Candidatus Gracilibacteria bacterium]|jgi:hypothetical protein